MKNNIGFFTHETDAPDNRKFLILRAYYGGAMGWAMEARFWALNCMIGESEGCRLNTNLKGEKARIARALELSIKELDTFIEVLRDEAELVKDDSGVLWTQQTQEDLERAINARKSAKNRRVAQKDTPSPDERKTSGDESQTSPDEKHGGEGKGLEGIRKEGKGGEGEKTRPPYGSKNNPGNEEAELFAFALRRIMARKNHPGDPEAMARKIMREPDVIAAFKKSIEPHSRSDSSDMPDEDPECPCGKKPKVNRYSGNAICHSCKRSWTYDHAFRVWVEDEPAQNTG